ncbi:putative polyketide synthase (plasmid) [Fulvitalea axinellae]|uniref:Polyketide synthase n=1 Tax=Fulvitalea axinellae TaxID=1182444 RepID=A0AAU9CNC6_9BACT|nr:putative polyketide synthase [Fulvitalea axinellae]
MSGKEKTKASETDERDPIAIVGIGCRFPGGVHGPDSYWEALKNGFDGITDVPADRWSTEEYYDPDTTKFGKIKSRKGGFIDTYDQFDPELFGLFPKEAESMDPQQRLLLESTFEAMEDSGTRLEELKGTKTSVFMGVFMNDYWDIQTAPMHRNRITPHIPMGVSLTSIANRISYVFDLKGASVSLDTACSSSLVALHLACRSIWDGEADQSMAGGVALHLKPESWMMLSKGGFLSPDGYCKSFDERANGYVRSEGVGVMMLKPLSKAKADGDDIYALIEGSAVNSDGFTADGYTVPSEIQQTAMLKAAYKDAGINPKEVQFVEAHGTGTKAGDPKETRAFANVFTPEREEGENLVIGSVKSNMGHTEAAAGVAGLIKLTLCIKNRQIPQNLHFQKGNPAIPFDEWKLKVPTELQEWPHPGRRLLGGLNSFGAGGTNAHLVVAEFVSEQTEGKKEDKKREMSLLTLSARSENALRDMADEYVAYLSKTQDSLGLICNNAGKYRSTFEYRLAVAGRTKEQMIESLEAYIAGEDRPGMVASHLPEVKKRKIGFVFSGQGPQWYAMARQLLETEPVFRNVVLEIEKHFTEIAPWSLLEEMMKDEENSSITDTRIAQPAIMAVQIGLMELWKSYGIEPEGVVGHSIGEIAAAYTSGALNLRQATEVIYHRSRGQNKASGAGKMLAVGVTHKEALELIKGKEHQIGIGAINSPNMVTLSGDTGPLEMLATELEEKDIFARFLRVTVPFHSHHMEPLKDDLISSLAHMQGEKAKIALYSTVTGKRESGEHLTSDYWYKNVRMPVYFTDGVSAMIEDGFDTFIEIAPHPVLSQSVVDLLAHHKKDGDVIPSIRRKDDDFLVFTGSVGKLFTIGVEPDWDLAHPATGKADLPGYPFQRSRYWMESDEHMRLRTEARQHPNLLLGTQSGANEDCFVWDIELDKATDPYIEDHQVDDVIIFPGAGHIELATVAGQLSFGEDFGFLEDINFQSALFLPDDGEPPLVRLEISNSEGRYWLSTKPRDEKDAKWTRHSNGKINHFGDKYDFTAVDLEELKERVRFRQPITPLYKELKQGGLLYGDTFRAITDLWTSPGEVLSQVTLHDSLEHGIERYNLHPAVLDACLHTIFAGKPSTAEEKRGIYLPVSMDRYKFFKKPASKSVWNYVKLNEVTDKIISGDLHIFDEEGDLVALVDNVRCKYIEGSRGESQHDVYVGSAEYRWNLLEEKGESAEATGNAVIFADARGVSGGIATALQAKGLGVVKVFEGNEFERVDDTTYRVNPTDQEQIARVLSEVGTVDRVVYLWGMHEEFAEENTNQELIDNQARLARRTFNTLCAIADAGLNPETWMVTSGYDLVTAEDDTVAMGQAVLAGTTRVTINEYPHIPMRFVDFSAEITDTEIATFSDVVLLKNEKPANTEWALRGDDVYVRRFEHVDPEEAETEFGKTKMEASGSAYRAEVLTSGDMDSLVYRAFHADQLASGDVRIEVKASGLSERDVQTAVGLLEEEAVEGGLSQQTLGVQCAGVVTAVSENVTGIKVGDSVMAWTANGLAGTVTTPSSCVAPKPESLDWQTAATVPVAYLTAYYALNRLAQIDEDDRVLIHNATGGTGLASVRLAQSAGAEVYATAATESGRDFLRQQGVENVFDSSELSFYDAVMEATEGQGVDVVLNTLSGKALRQSLKCLRAFGRFVELGKTDIYNDASLDLKRFGDNLSYHAVDMDRIMAGKPKLGARMFAEVTALLDSGKIKADAPKVFEATAMVAALKTQAEADNIGDVAVVMESGVEVDVLPAQKLTLHKDGTYVVTGGASGTGLELAKWLTEEGAGHLVLMSRSGTKSDYDREVIAKMEEAGVKVDLPKGDITDYEAVKSVFDGLEAKGWPAVRGIIHSAGLLADATLPRMDDERFKSVYNPKVIGAWNLHKASAGHPLDFCLFLSSVSSIFGLPGQVNYSSANNFLDRLAMHRQTQGLAGSSVNLGVMGNFAGMSREGGNVMNVLGNQGWLPMTFKSVKTKIEKLLLQRRSARMAADIDWKRFREFFIHLTSDARFAHLLTDEALNVSGSGSAGGTLKDQVMELEGEAREALLTEKLTEALAKILGTSPDKVDPGMSISKIGLDSLMQTQLRNWVHQKVEVNYPLMKIAKGPSLAELAGNLLEELSAVTEEGAGEGPDGRPLVVGTSNDVMGLTDAEDAEVLANKYLVRIRSAKTETARLRVFCCHPVGAGASMFSHFMYNAPDDVDIYAFQMPGRENRLDEASHSDIRLLVDEMGEAIQPYLDRPFALWGHSFGGIVMFELAHHLREQFGKNVSHFFASATIAPQLTTTWRNSDIISETALRETSEQRLLSLMSYIDDEDFVLQILPIMRNDMPLIMNYPYADRAPLDCSITVFSAFEDDVVTAKEMEQWEIQTTANFRQEIVHGDHWFLSRNRDFVLEVLSRDLSEVMDVMEQN